MSDRKFRRSDVIARENREKRVTRISRQRLKGLIEEAVENIINEGHVGKTVPDDYKPKYKDVANLYKIKMKMANKNRGILGERMRSLMFILKKLGIPTTNLDFYQVEPIYNRGELWGFGIGIFLEDFDLSSYNYNDQKLIQGVIEEMLYGCDFALSYKLDNSNFEYTTNYVREHDYNHHFYFYIYSLTTYDDMRDDLYFEEQSEKNGNDVYDFYSDNGDGSDNYGREFPIDENPNYFYSRE